MSKYLLSSSEMIFVSDIHSLEERYGILPDTYKALLLRENGGVARLKTGQDHFLFYSIDNSANDLGKI